MKRNLFTIGAALVIGFSATAQKLTTRGNWSVIDSSEVVTTVMIEKDLIGMDMNYDNWQGDPYAGTAWSADGKELIMKYDGSKFNPAPGDLQWGAVVTNFQQWDGANDANDKPTLTDKFYSQDNGSGGKVTNSKPMIVRGKTVDFSNPLNAYLEFEYTLTSNQTDVKVQFDLIDILGRRANSSDADPVSRAVGSLKQSTTFKKVVVTWNPEDDGDADISASIESTEHGSLAPHVSDAGKLELFCKYSPKYHDVENPAVGKDPLENRGDSEVAVERLCGIAFAIFPDYEKGTETATLTIRKIKFGAGYVGIKTVSGAELQVVGGVVYSAGQIVVTSVTGQVVAVANGQFDTNTLKGGIYVIKAAEGTAKIVK